MSSTTDQINTVIKRYYNSESSGTEQIESHKFVRGLIGTILQYGLLEITTTNERVSKDIEEKVIEICDVDNNNVEKTYIKTRSEIAWEKQQEGKGFESYETLRKIKKPEDLAKLLTLLEIPIPNTYDNNTASGAILDDDNNDEDNEDDENEDEKEVKRRNKKKKLVKELYKRYSFSYNTDTGEFLYYDGDGVYKPKADLKIKNFIEKLHPFKHGQEMKGSVIETIKDQNHSTNKDFDADIDILNLTSGLYNVLTEELKPHTPHYLSRIQHPIIFNPSARCPKTLKFLTELVDDPLERINLIYASANTFRRNFDFPYETFLWGDGSNGKSVYCGKQRSMLGEENCSAESLDDLLGRDKFSRAQLFGKCANFDAELTKLSVKDSVKKKKLSSDDLQSFRDLYKSAFKGKSFAKQFFNGNALPKFDDKTGGRYRREIVITCGKTITGKKKDKKLLSKITTEEENSGFFNVLRFALKVMITNEDVFELNVEKQREGMELVSDPKEKWWEKQVDIYIEGMRDEVYDEETGILLTGNTLDEFKDCNGAKRAFFDDFISWYKKNNLKPAIASTRIQDLGEFIRKKILESDYYNSLPTAYRPRIEFEKRETDEKTNKTKKTECWAGARLKPDQKTLLTDLREKRKAAEELERHIEEEGLNY